MSTKVSTLAVLALSLPSAGLAQSAESPHQHGQSATAVQPAQTHQQHRAVGGAEHAVQPQAGHPDGCACPCCAMMRQMMMEMMQRHQQSGSMQPMQRPETPAPAEPEGEHEDHDQHQPS